MHTGEYIRTVRFDKAVRGYNKEDVDTFLDEIADDVDSLIEQNRALSKRLAEALKTSDGITPTPVPVVDNSGSVEQVQSILVSAQRFSDQIVNEANQKAAEILDAANLKAREIDEKVATALEAFEKEIAERKDAADEEVGRILTSAAQKSEGLINAAHDSVARQQLLFDKLRLETSEFKKQLFENHKMQLELLQKFPDSVPFDPETAAKAVEFIADSQPDFASFIPTFANKTAEEKPQLESDIAEDVSNEDTEETSSFEVFEQVDTSVAQEESFEEEDSDDAVVETQITFEDITSDNI